MKKLADWSNFDASWAYFHLKMAVTRPEWPRRWAWYDRFYWRAFVHGYGVRNAIAREFRNK